MSGTDDLYIGLIPPQAGCGGTCGLGGGMTALYFTDDLPEASHEIGHALGRPHTPCSVHASGEDPNYPMYNGYPRGSIGEVGVDATRLTAFDPNTTFDFMSYCDPLWVSPWTYQQLSAEIFRAARTSAPRALPISPWSAETAEFHYVSFRIHRAIRNEPPRVDLTSAFHLRRTAPRFTGDSEVTVELLGEAGQLLGVQAAPQAHAHASAGDPFVDHRAYFPAHAELRSLRVVRTGIVLAEWQVAARAPSVAITETRHEPHQDRLFLRWRGDADPEAAPSLSYGVRYSHDGKRWRALAAGLTGSELAIDLASLPGGERCCVQVIASAGLRTAVAETAPFAVSTKPRRVLISSPKAGAEYVVGAPIPLSGAAFSPDFGMAAHEDIGWESRLVGHLGTGQQVTMRELPPGRHRITMYAPDGQGGEAQASVEIRVVEHARCA
jgi:hypothetical protein